MTIDLGGRGSNLTHRSIAGLRQHWSARLKGLGLDGDSDVDALRSALARERGRPIELVPVTTGAGPHGLLIETDTADYIAFERDTTAVHQRHIVVHELAHLACGHHSGLTRHDLVRLLMPNLKPALVRTVLSRTIFSEAEEREAELFATLFLERASASAPLVVAPAAVARFEALLCGQEALA